MHSTDPVNRHMTECVLTVDIDDPAGEVLRLFAAHPVHHLPVLENDKVVGMLSSADVMKLEMFLPKGSGSPIEYLNQRIKVRALLRQRVLTVEARQSVYVAAQLMAQHGVHALPVVTSQDRLVGIITTTDIIRAALAETNADCVPDAGGATLSTLQARVASLDRVRHLANRFLKGGLDPELHGALTKALEAVSRAEERHGSVQLRNAP